MASEVVANDAPALASSPSPIQAWLARLGLSGKLLGIGALVGVIAVFLPLVSVSVQMSNSLGVGQAKGKGGFNIPALDVNQRVLVIQDFRGVICLLGYAAALALTYVLYAPTGLQQKSLGWAGVGVGGLTALLSLWLLFTAYSGSSALSGFGASFQVSVGIGAIFNLLAAGTVAAGGFLKAREEKLI
jgi:hypothetical protein